MCPSPRRRAPSTSRAQSLAPRAVVVVAASRPSPTTASTSATPGSFASTGSRSTGPTSCSPVIGCAPPISVRAAAASALPAPTIHARPSVSPTSARPAPTHTCRPPMPRTRYSACCSAGSSSSCCAGPHPWPSATRYSTCATLTIAVTCAISHPRALGDVPPARPATEPVAPAAAVPRRTQKRHP